MLETIVTIILIPFALGAIVLSGAILVGVIKCFKRNK
jgi:hypothetical protein